VCVCVCVPLLLWADKPVTCYPASLLEARLCLLLLLLLALGMEDAEPTTLDTRLSAPSSRQQPACQLPACL